MEEEIPVNALRERGMGFLTVAYADSDHTGDTITRQSRTEFIIYFNSSTIYWLPKKQHSMDKKFINS